MTLEEYTDVSVLDSYDHYLRDGKGYADGDPNHLTYYEYAAWQILRPGEGTTTPFVLSQDISAQVLSPFSV